MVRHCHPVRPESDVEVLIADISGPGPYITSTLTNSEVDPKRNIGFIIKYEAGKDEILRINTRSLTSEVSRENPDVANQITNSDDDFPKDTTSPDTKKDDSNSSTSTSGIRRNTPPPNSGERILAFKALSADASLKAISRVPSPLRKSADSDEETLVLGICDDIERACRAVNPALRSGDRDVVDTAEAAHQEGESGGGGDGGEVGSKKRFVERKDVVSLAEAKKSTGLLEQVGYSIRRWVWA